MATLADELLADFEDDFQQQEDQAVDGSSENVPTFSETSMTTSISNREKFKETAKLFHSHDLGDILDQIRHFQSTESATTAQNSAVEDHPEYQLIVRANSMAVEIDSEVLLVHKFIRDLYAKRFPELESLVLDPLEFVQTVKLLKNSIDISTYNTSLRSILKSATVMVLTVTSTTTAGVELSQDDLDVVLMACDAVLSLVDSLNLIIDYVQSRMAIIAPNLSVIVGSKSAAQLMGAAGGLASLGRVPACNFPMLGSTKVHAHGLSSANPALRNGFIYECPVIRAVPLDYRTRAVRLVAAKAALAARVDSAHESPDGAIGRRFRADIDGKIEKWQEPGQLKDVKALEVPDEEPKRRRGGKRIRQQNAKFTITEMQKQANRMAFGVAEEEIMHFDETEGLGMIGKNLGTGKVRATQVDQRVKAKVRQPINKKHQSQQPSSGLSSLVFTPVQGMELVDPEAQKKKLEQINAKWTASNAKFVNVNRK